jgi:hypothetical protein
MPGTDRHPSSPLARSGLAQSMTGVDQHQRLVALLRHIDDNHPLMDVDLRRGQANALRVVHGFQHVGNEGAHARIDRQHRFGDGMQPWIGVTENGKKGHGIGSQMSLFSPLFTFHAAAETFLRCSIKGLSAESRVICQDF